MFAKEYKVLRDPIHGNIILFPFELRIIDLKIFQRLRYLKQTPSVTYVFYSSNHTRFEHSIGSLHIAEMYARTLKIPDPKKELLRLCALLHDIAHGIFSHLYDETVYKEIYPEEEHPHDEHRMKIIKQYLPDALHAEYTEEELEESINLSGLGEYLKRKQTVRDTLQQIMDEVAVILGSDGTFDHNIVQGPLGCDRMDFVKRDSYFSGTGHYGGFPLDRIIQFSSKEKRNGQEILCYSSKILDDILLFLINRFHMYKNVYFNKTCRAVDLMLQQVLRHSMEPLGLAERTKDFKKFEELSEISLFHEISSCYREKFDELEERILRRGSYTQTQVEEMISNFLNEKTDIDGFYSKIRGIFKDLEEKRVREELNMLKSIFRAHELVTRILRRDLYKTVKEQSFILRDDQIVVLSSSDIARNTAETEKSRLRQLYLQVYGEECPELFTDTPYEIKMSPLFELPNSNIYICDETDGKVKSFEEIGDERSFKEWSLGSFNTFRIYATSEIGNEKFAQLAKMVEGKTTHDTSY